MNKQMITITLLLLGTIMLLTGCQYSATPAPTHLNPPTQTNNQSPNDGSRVLAITPEPSKSLGSTQVTPSQLPNQLPSTPFPAQRPSKVPPRLDQANKPTPQPKKLTIPKEAKVKPQKSNTKMHQAHQAPSSSARKIAYLTFDDGPSRVTGRVLNTLKHYKVKATFFVIGNASLEGRSLYKRIVTEGHAIGNHSYSHNYKQIYQSVATFERDVNKLNNLLEQTISFRPDIIRFPGGSNNTVSYRAGGRNIMKRIASEVSDQGYQYFDWNVDSSDASAAVRSKAQIISSVKREAVGQDRIIVLMHDAPGRTSTADALPEIIEFLISQGYRFEKLNKSAFTCQFLLP